MKEPPHVMEPASKEPAIESIRVSAAQRESAA